MLLKASFVLALASIGTGCLVHSRGEFTSTGELVIDEEPPPPRVVQVDVRPGYVYVDGRWTHNGRRWDWHEGRYERDRAGHSYSQGRWERRGHRHAWVSGGWRANGGGGR